MSAQLDCEGLEVDRVSQRERKKKLFLSDLHNWSRKRRLFSESARDGKAATAAATTTTRRSTNVAKNEKREESNASARSLLH